MINPIRTAAIYVALQIISNYRIYIDTFVIKIIKKLKIVIIKIRIVKHKIVKLQNESN